MEDLALNFSEDQRWTGEATNDFGKIAEILCYQW